MSRRLTGAVLAAALSKAAEAAIAGAVETGAQRLATAVDAGLGLPSPPLWGRAGEGGAATGGDLPSGTLLADSGDPLPDRPAQGGRATERSQRSTGKKGGVSTTLTLAAPNLFAREFGALNAPADPVLAPAIDAIRRRPA